MSNVIYLDNFDSRKSPPPPDTCLHIPAWAFWVDGLNLSDITIYSFLMHCARKDDQDFKVSRSASQISKQLNISCRQVQRALKRLQDKELLIRIGFNDYGISVFLVCAPSNFQSLKGVAFQHPDEATCPHLLMPGQPGYYDNF